MVIADTGFFLAIAHTRDKFHQRAVQRFSELQGETLITTWPVMAETCHLLLHRVGEAGPTKFLRTVSVGAVEVFDLQASHLPRIVELMEAYANLPMDLADASMVILAEHLGHGRILSTDQRDFGAYRWKQREPFENLLTRDGQST